MRFKKGQEVVCTKRGVWRSRVLGAVKPGPKFNELVTVDFPSATPGTITLREYPMIGFVSDRFSYEEDFFEPLISDDDLENELQSIEQPYFL